MSALLTAPITPHCQPCPGATLAFVFICPGRFEAARGYPCAAGTGANLARVLVELHARSPLLFPSPSRDAYLITNAWATVEYPALTGRSVPTEAEVLAPDNLERLAGELAGVDRVIACGAQAHAALRELARRRPSMEVAYGRHLSQRSINSLAGGSNTPERIGCWVDLVLAQWRPGAGQSIPASSPKPAVL
jgi:hypothetical protein